MKRNSMFGVLAGLGAVALSVGITASARGARVRDAAMASATEARVRDADIAFYAARAARDVESAGDRTQLAGLYLQRARATGSNDDVLRAEDAARSSLALRTAHNGKAPMALASALLAQHRFAEALIVARSLLASDPLRVGYRAQVAEIEMELGHYAEADTLFRGLEHERTNLGVAPRLSRWAELHGRLDEAHALIVNARDLALRQTSMPHEQIAWFHLRVGDLAQRNGHLDEAAREFSAGLEVQPDDYRLLGARARLAANRQQWREAIAFGERALAITLDPITLGTVGEAYAATGDSASAEDFYRTMEVAVGRQAGPFHRAWSLFLLDHDRRVPEVLARVRAEIAERHDVYGYDLLAWALYKAGRPNEAAAADRSALQLGTRDPLLLFHAGMIARALGDTAAARRHLGDAIALNPSFHPAHAIEARAVLMQLGTGR
ncbi:MAG: hypothetical protein ABI637_06550 [Gemmatimonadota bacterium]